MCNLLLAVIVFTLPKSVMIGLFLYLLAVNIAAFALFGLDKHRARTAGWRIPEAAFFLLALAGSVPGLWFGMGAFHHKTSKAGFRVGLPLIALVHVFAAFWLLRK